MTSPSISPSISPTDLGKLQREAKQALSELKNQTEIILQEAQQELLELEKRGCKIDRDQISSFLDHWWHTYPTKNPNEWEVAIPVFLPFNFGYFDRIEGGYKIFIVNRFTRWLGEAIPDFIEHEISLPQPLDITLDGLNLKFPEGKEEIIERKYGSHLSLIEQGKATVKQAHVFDLLAEIIDAGSLPFIPKPVDPADLMESDFTQIYDEVNSTPEKSVYIPLNIFEGKYSYQGEAFNTFLKHGSVGIFWLMSLGKTVEGTYILSRIKGPKLLIVPSITLKEQWELFFKRNCPRLLNEVEIYTYQGLSRNQETFKLPKDKIFIKYAKTNFNQLLKKNYKVTIYEECHFLPATTFSPLAMINTDYRVGFSGTPYREDGKTNYIMALTGFPLGLDARSIMRVLGKVYHPVNVHIVQNLDAKFILAKQLYNPERKTMFFVYLKEIGNKLAEMFELPFISGDTKNRLQLIQQSFSFVASKTLEHGLSIKDLEHIIEVDFQFGGRQEQTQRTGRLLHSEAKLKIHDIIMTKDEFERYGKRLYGLFEKGFQPKLIPHLLMKATEIKQKKTQYALHERAKSWRKVIDEMYEEGFFQITRNPAVVKEELVKRGIKVDASVQRNMFNKLMSMVKKKQLWRTDGAYKARTG